MAAARRGWGTGASAEPGPVLGLGRGCVLVRVKAAAKGAAEEAEEQEVSRQEQYRGRVKPNVARTARHHTPGEAGIGENEAGNEVMAGSRRLGLWDMQSWPTRLGRGPTLTRFGSCVA